MSLLDGLRRIIGSVATPAPRAEYGTSVVVYDLKDPAFLDLLRGGGVSTDGRVLSPKTALNISTAWRCIQILCGAIGSIPLALHRKVTETNRPMVDPGHPIQRLLTKKPNDWQRPAEFRQTLTLHLILRGNAYAWKIRGARNRVISLIPLNPDRVTVRMVAGFRLEYVYELENGGTRVLKQEDVLHLRALSADGYTGMSLLAHAAKSIGLAEDADRAVGKIFRQGNLAGSVLMHKETLSDEARDRLKADLHEQYAGADNAGKTMVLEEGMTFERLGMLPTDLQFLQLRQHQVSEIARWFGVPDFLVNETEKTTSWGTGIEHQSIGFLQFTIEPWLTIWREAINASLIEDDEDDLYAQFDVDHLLRADLKTQTEYFSKMYSIGVLSSNDIRAQKNLPPRPGGDEYVSPLNMSVSGGEKKDDPEADDTEKRPPAGQRARTPA